MSIRDAPSVRRTPPRRARSGSRSSRPIRSDRRSTSRSTRPSLELRTVAAAASHAACWLRRLVRRGWIALAAVVVAELVALDRSPGSSRSKSAPLVGAAIPVVGPARLARRRDPGTTRDRRDGAGRRCRGGGSAIACRAHSSSRSRSRPRRGRPPTVQTTRSPPTRSRRACSTTRPRPTASSAASGATPSRPLRTVRPTLFRATVLAPTGRRGRRGRPAAGPGRCSSRTRRTPSSRRSAQVREAADRQADRHRRDRRRTSRPRAPTRTTRGRGSPQELRELARQLRERPNDLDVNLARLGRDRGRRPRAARPGERAAGRRR